MSDVRWPVVLFDLDGTLANTIDAIVASYVYTWGTVGREVTREQILSWIGRTLLDVFREEAPDQAEHLELVYREHNFANLERLVKPYDGIPELLRDLHAAGATTGIVTAKRRYSAEPSMRYANLPETAILACAMEDTTAHKPDPTPLLKGLEHFGATPDQAVYIGDAIFDLQAAQRAGMPGIGVTWGAGTHEELLAQPHEAIVDDVDALRRLLFV